MPSNQTLRAGLAAAFFLLPQTGLAQSAGGTASGDSQVETTAKPADADTVVATVNGTEITLGHMIMVRAGLPQQYGQLPPDVLFEGILDQLAQQIVLGQTWEGDAPKSVTLGLETERYGRMASAVVAKFLETAVSEDAIKAAYEEKFAGADSGVEYKASHILVETEEEARKLIAELDGGADFATLARDHSTGPSGPNGGDLGWFGPGMMVKPFEEAVATLEPGGYTKDPVKTQFGWHVVLLVETRAKEAPALEAVRDELIVELQNAAVEAHIDSLIAKADIDRSSAKDIDAALLTQTDLVE